MGNLPFDLDQLVSLAAAFIAIIMAGAEVKFTQRAMLTRLKDIEDAMSKIKDGAVSAALLERAISQLEAEVRSLRTTAITMDRFMVRVSTRLQMEQDHSANDQR